MIKRFSAILVLLALFASCDTKRVFEADRDFENEVWQMDTIPVFIFEVEDSRPKNLAIKLRNDLTYPYQNCYVNYKLKDAEGKVLKDNLVSLQLFDEKTGKPMGKGNSIYQFKKAILSDYEFPSTGSFSLEVAQYMRTSELMGTYSVGLRVEDAE